MTPEDLRARMNDAVLVLDGGLATELEARGSDIGGALWSARVLRDEPRSVVEAHRAFVSAGAQVLTSASYQVSRRGLTGVGGTDAEADVLLRRSVELAREAASGTDVLVAASIGPYGATNHDGSEYRGGYGLDVAALADFHRERIEPLLLAEPDLLAIETIPDLDEVAAIVEVLAEHPGIAAWVSMTTLDGRTLCAGQPLAEAAHLLASASSVAAVGVNCSAPHLTLPALRAMAHNGTALLAYPNAGQAWDSVSETWSGAAEPVFDLGAVMDWRNAGVRAIGGCCGVGPEGIRALVDVVR